MKPMKVNGASPMNVKRIFALVAVGAGLAALATSAATTGTRRPVSPIAARAHPDAALLSGAALAEEIARLHERLHPSTPPQEPARNLFRFRGTPSRTTGLSESAAPAASTNIPAQPAPPPPSRPVMELIGIAEQPEGDRVVRTAIISEAGELFLVKEGERLDSRFRVERISSNVVELSDTESSAALRLALK